MDAFVCGNKLYMDIQCIFEGRNSNEELTL